MAPGLPASGLFRGPGLPLPLETGKHLGVLEPHRLQRPRVQAEQLQDGRRDLGRLHPTCEIPNTSGWCGSDFGTPKNCADC